MIILAGILSLIYIVQLWFQLGVMEVCLALVGETAYQVFVQILDSRLGVGLGWSMALVGKWGLQ